MTWIFLLPLVLGFTSNTASAFTAAFSRRWGEKGGRAASFVLRNVLGIPVWAMGFVLAVRTPSLAYTHPTGCGHSRRWMEPDRGGRSRDPLGASLAGPARCRAVDAGPAGG